MEQRHVGALLTEALTIADITRLEIHGPADELQKLRPTLDPFKPRSSPWNTDSGQLSERFPALLRTTSDFDHEPNDFGLFVAECAWDGLEIDLESLGSVPLNPRYAIGNSTLMAG